MQGCRTTVWWSLLGLLYLTKFLNMCWGWPLPVENPLTGQAELIPLLVPHPRNGQLIHASQGTSDTPTCWRALQVHGSLLTRVYSPLISARVVGIRVLSLGTTEPTEHGSSYTPAHAICCSKTGLLRCGTTRQSIAWTGCPREGATGLWDVSQRVSCFVPGLTWFSLRCSLKDSWTLLWSRVVEKPVFGSTGTLFTRYVCMHGFLLSLYTYKLFNRKSLQKLDTISPKYMLLLNSGSYYREIPGQKPQTTASVCLKWMEISKPAWNATWCSPMRQQNLWDFSH